MLLEPPNQLLLLVALVGPLDLCILIDRGCGIQWNFHRVGWKSIPLQQVLAPLLPVLIEPPIPIYWRACLLGLYSRIDQAVGLGRSIRMDLLYRRGVL